MKNVHLVLPSLKVSGGTLEALRLGKELQQLKDTEVDVITLWRSPHALRDVGLLEIPMSTWHTKPLLALLQLPLLALRFSRQLRAQRREISDDSVKWIFTHFSTFPLAWLVPARQRWFFVQDLEWRFAPKGWMVKLLKSIILATYRRGLLVTANRYLTDQLRLENLQVAAEASIWADVHFDVKAAPERDIDLVMVLRKGAHKRLDLYLQFIERMRQADPEKVLAVITPEDSIAAQVREQVQHCVVRPDQPTMAALFARSRVFLHLSEHEGFGLPPLEAMGAGCVPLCRDSGGVRAYMTDAMLQQLMPLHTSVDEIVGRVLQQLDDPGQWQNLSTLARTIFSEGQELTRRRSELLSCLLNAA